MAEYLTRKSTGWFKGCGCGQKPGDLVTPPNGSVEAWFPTSEVKTLVGPVTGIKYNVVPNVTSIDVDAKDYAAWAGEGIVQTPRPGFKGMLTRE